MKNIIKDKHNSGTYDGIHYAYHDEFYESLVNEDIGQFFNHRICLFIEFLYI